MRDLHIDGLRGAAALAVLSLHAGMFPFGGWGVQVFFVISGFVITRLLKSELRTKTYTYFGFVERRLIRLFPALILLIASSLVYAIFFAPAPFGTATLWGALYSFFYLSNLAQSFPTFFPWPWLGVLGHTWTLSVEMQFYLIWPVLLQQLLKLKPQKAMLLLAGTFLLLTLLRMGLNQNPDNLPFVINSLLTNSTGLILGASLNFVNFKKHKARWISTGGLLLLITFGYSSKSEIGFSSNILSDFNLGMTGVEIGAALLLVGNLISSSGLIAKILSSRLMVFLGTISYGIYLWHFPVIVAINASYIFYEQPISLFAFTLIFSITAATASNYLFENPVRRFLDSRRQREGIN